MTGAWVGPCCNPIDFLNPLSAGGGYHWFNKIFSHLVTYDVKYSQILPDLAESWSTSEDGQTWTFKLRQGVTFHDGGAFTANDVVFSIEICLDPQVKCNKAGELGTIAGAKDFIDGKATSVSGLKVVDDNTLDVTTDGPNAAILDTFAETWILSKASMEGVSHENLDQNEYWRTKSVGTGPFKFVQFVDGQYIETAAFDNYWRGRPKIDKLIRREFKDPATALLAFDAGEIDFTYLTLDELERESKNENAVVIPGPSQVDNAITLNPAANPVFGDPKFHQAILYAIDRKSIIESIYKGAATAVPCFYGNPKYHPEGIEPYDYNPEKAKALLAELGVDTASLPEFVLDTYYNDQLSADVMTVIQANLADVMDGPSAEEIAAARLAIVQAEDTVTSTQRSLNSVLKPNVAYYQEQYQRAQEDVTAAQASVDADQYQISLRSASDALASAKSNLEQWQRLETMYPGYGEQHGNGFVNAQNRYARAVEDYNVAVANAQQSSTANVNTLTDAQSALQTAQANLAAAQSGPDSADVQLYTAKLEQAQADLAAARTTLDDLLSQPDEQAIADARAAVANAEENASRNQIVAPFSGTVLGIYNRVGDRVSSGTNAVVIADISSLKIQVSVSEVDVNQITPGQAVSITVDAAPDAEYSGQVDQLISLGVSNSGVVTFPVIVNIPDPDPALKPGMSAAVNIVVAEHADAILVPNKAIRVANGKRTVTVMNGGGQMQQVEVTIGLTNETYSEILSGSLKQGDRLMISTSTSSSSSSTSTTGGRNNGGFGGGPFLDGGGPPAGP